MADPIRLQVDGATISVEPGTSVAAAIAVAGRSFVRRSVGGEPRGPVCGMGICFECRATIDGRTHQRTCQLPCRDGMDVRTDG